jgi:N-methylhydantoinase B
MTEAVAPVLITKRELRCDSGGAGTFRGGLGQHIEMISATDEDIMLFLSVERIKNPARGRNGGHAGAPGRVRIGMDGPDLPGKGEVRIPAGKTLVFETPGGGGFGDPAQRAPEDIARDIAFGLVSRDKAQRNA